MNHRKRNNCQVGRRSECKLSKPKRCFLYNRIVLFWGVDPIKMRLLETWHSRCCSSSSFALFSLSSSFSFSSRKCHWNLVWHFQCSTSTDTQWIFYSHPPCFCVIWILFLVSVFHIESFGNSVCVWVCVCIPRGIMFDKRTEIKYTWTLIIHRLAWNNIQPKSWWSK